MIEITNLDRIICNALEEDIGTGDITTLSTVDPDEKVAGSFIAKQEGVICGLQVCSRVFELLGGEVEISFHTRDGDIVKKGDVIADIQGNARCILSGERVALNFLQRMSGIATKTRSYVDILSGTDTVLTDTRKTTPGLRSVEKYSVRIGGAANHRYNLSDGVLIKDNHIVASGGIKQAVSRCKGNISHLIKIEVETENMEQIKEAMEAGAEVIMLDNMSIEEMERAVRYIDGKALTEASGNMDEMDLRAVAETGVDFISIGALTHSFDALDISLKFK